MIYQDFDNNHQFHLNFVDIVVNDNLFAVAVVVGLEVVETDLELNSYKSLDHTDAVDVAVVEEKEEDFLCVAHCYSNLGTEL